MCLDRIRSNMFSQHRLFGTKKRHVNNTQLYIELTTCGLAANEGNLERPDRSTCRDLREQYSGENTHIQRDRRIQ